MTPQLDYSHALGDKTLYVRPQQEGGKQMARKIELVRRWLETNKIWFETIAASLLSLMAIVVSVAQNSTSSKQTGLLSLQTQLAEAQALPQFEVAIRQKLNTATGKFDDDSLVISNRGGPIHDFTADAAYFLKVTTPGAGLDIVTTNTAVNGYFTASFISVAGTGELVTMIGNHNNARVVELLDSLKEAARARKLTFANLTEQIVVRLRYVDLLNRRHEDYFSANPVGGGSRMADEVGKARFAKWDAAPRVELSNLRAEDLLDGAGALDPGRP